MAMKTDKGASKTTQPAELLGQLPPIDIQKEKLPPKLEDNSLETQLLTLADISLERETEVLKDLIAAAKKA